MKHEIWRLKDARECYNTTTGEAVPYLTYYGAESPGVEVMRRDAGDATLEELVWLCDQNAESCNAHDFCGAHRLLAAVLYRRLGRTKATATMREIAEFGGLHGMAGICGKADAYGELEVGKAGFDWDGSFGA